MNFVIGGKLCVGLDPAGERGHEFLGSSVCSLERGTQILSAANSLHIYVLYQLLKGSFSNLIEICFATVNSNTKRTIAYSMTISLSRHPQGRDQMMSVPLVIGGI